MGSLSSGRDTVPCDAKLTEFGIVIEFLTAKSLDSFASLGGAE